MLTALPPFDLAVNIQGGLRQTSIRAQTRDPRGIPLEGAQALGPWSHALNPGLNGFVAASADVDDLTIAIGFYTLGARLSPNASDNLREHAVGQSFTGCDANSDRTCARNTGLGGNYEVRSDATLAVAWHLLPIFDVGLAMHFPFLALRRAHDELASNSGNECLDPLGFRSREDGSLTCNQRFVLDAGTRARFVARERDDASRIDFAVTAGIAVRPHPRWQLGARFRFSPVLERGQYEIFGEAISCPLDDDGEPSSQCGDPTRTPVVVQQRLPMEAAFGAAVQLGPANTWRLDANLYWIDGCPGRGSASDCARASQRDLAATSTDTSPEARVHEKVLYRGLRDVFGLELWGERRLRTTRRPGAPSTSAQPGLDLLFGIAASTPTVIAGASTPTTLGGYWLSGSMGTRISLPMRNSSIELIPGYALDITLPVRIGEGGRDSTFDPRARREFELTGADISAPSAAAVLEGRARASNAGIHFELEHTLMLNLRWTQRLP